MRLGGEIVRLHSKLHYVDVVQMTTPDGEEQENVATLQDSVTCWCPVGVSRERFEVIYQQGQGESTICDWSGPFSKIAT